MKPLVFGSIRHRLLDEMIGGPHSGQSEMLLRRWSILNFCLVSAILPAIQRAACADELLQEQMSESRSIATTGEFKCEISHTSSALSDNLESCVPISHKISGHVRVDMGSRLPFGPDEVWPGGQILPVRANLRNKNSDIPGHLHLGMSESSEARSPVH